MNKHPNHKAIAMIVSLSLCALASRAGSVVKVVGAPGAWHLTVNGKPFFVQGAGGDAPKPLLAKTGGNAFRTWGADNLKGQLDEAKANGLMLMAGFWLGHAEHGFNYTCSQKSARSRTTTRSSAGRSATKWR